MVQSILIIRLSSMGDILLTTPLIRQIRKQYPNIRLDMMVDERFSETICHNPHLNTVYQYRRSYTHTEKRLLCDQICAALPNDRYDLVIDLQNNRRSTLLRRRLGNHYTVVHKQRLKKLALVYLGWNCYSTLKSIAHRYQDAAFPLNIYDDGEGLEYWLPEERSQPYPFPHYRPTHGNQIRIAIAPGAHHATKRWLPERFAAAALQIAVSLGATARVDFCVLGGIADREVCRAVVQSLGDHYNVVDYSGSQSLETTARALDTSSLLLCNDTGIMHLAAARKLPLVAIFGSTVQEFGFMPYRTPAHIVEVPRDTLPCRPCTHIGRASCPKHHFNCMNQITVSDVAQAATQLLISL